MSGGAQTGGERAIQPLPATLVRNGHRLTEQSGTYRARAGTPAARATPSLQVMVCGPLEVDGCARLSVVSFPID